MASGGVGRFRSRRDPLVDRLVQSDLHKALKGIFPKASSAFLMNEVSTAYNRMDARRHVGESEMLASLTESLLTKDIPQEDISQLATFTQGELSSTDVLGIVPDTVDVIEDHLRNDLFQCLMKIFPKAHRGFLMANISTVVQNLGPSEDRKLETLIYKIVEHASVPKDTKLGLNIFDTSQGNEIQSSATSVRANFSSHAPSPDFECGCCFSSTSWPQKVSCASDHGFCRECVQRYVNHVISGEGSSLFACLSDGCQAPFPSAQLHFLDPNLLKRLEERRQSEEVGKALADCDDGQIFQCPSCEFKCLIPESNKVMECLNPKCLKDSCKLCKEDWDKHFGLPCDEVEAKGESDLRVRTEEAMTNAVVRRCIKCNAPFVKEAGCNKMTCRCGSMQCYICRKSVQSYKEHFCQHVTEGQKCTECTKCLLFEDIQREDEARVEMERQQGAECLFEQGYSVKGNTIFNSKGGSKAFGKGKATPMSNGFDQSVETTPKRVNYAIPPPPNQHGKPVNRTYAGNEQLEAQTTRFNPQGSSHGGFQRGGHDQFGNQRGSFQQGHSYSHYPQQDDYFYDDDSEDDYY